jgi:ribosomal protein L17
MLEFAERTLIAVKGLRRQTEELVTSGKVKDMEQYRFLMGRLEGYKFVEMEIQHLLSKNQDQ